MEDFIKRAPQLAWNNKQALMESEVCGCYYCCAIQSRHDIFEWTDYGKTAICPCCEQDCVIAQSHGISMDATTMKLIHDQWLVADQSKTSS